MTSPGSTYDDYPSPDFPTAPRDREREPPLPPTRFGRTSEDRERPPSGNARPRRSQDDHNPPVVGRRGDDLYGEVGSNEPISDRDPYAPSRRKPSQDTTSSTARSQQQDSGRRPSVASGSDSTNAQSATVTSGIIIPNKSTIAEEDIEVPYGRGESAPEDGDGETDEVEGGLGALARRLGQDPDTDGGARSDDYYDKISFGRASVASDRSAQRVAGRVSTAPNEEGEKMRRDYEFRIAKMQSRIVNLEREIEDGDVRTRQLEQSDQRIRQLEDELDKFRRVCFVVTSFPIRDSALYSEQRNKVLPCWLFRRSSMTSAKKLSAPETGKHDACNRMKRSYRSCANAANDWKRNVPRRCAHYHFSHVTYAQSSLGRLRSC
jgi:protein SPA2